jgi:hypothetical protein
VPSPLLLFSELLLDPPDETGISIMSIYRLKNSNRLKLSYVLNLDANIGGKQVQGQVIDLKLVDGA